MTRCADNLAINAEALQERPAFGGRKLEVESYPTVTIFMR